MEQKNSKETYDQVITRLLDSDGLPTIEEMFQKGDNIYQKKQYTTQ